MSHYQPERPPRRPGRAVALVLLLVVAVVAWLGGQRQRGEPRSGDHLPGRATHPTADAVPQRFRVSSFNIQSGRGTDGKTDLARTAKLLGSFDLIGINEAQGHVLRRDNQLDELGQLLDAPRLFAASERRWWHDDFGNGLVSRLPVRHWSVEPLPGQRSSGYRSLVRATLPAGDGRTLQVLVTHLDRTTDRLEQLRLVGALFLSLREPAILMGDLNTRGDDPTLAEILAAAGVDDPIGDTPKLPAKERIDWILTRGLRTIDGGAVITAASDHPLVWAEVELPPLTEIERPVATTPATSSTQPTDGD